MHSMIKNLLAVSMTLPADLAAHAGATDKQPIVIVVEYTAVHGKERELLKDLLQHAQLTKEEEPGCLRFDVLKPVDGTGAPIPDHILLTELYKDQDSANIHAKNARLPELRKKISPLLMTEKVTQTKVLMPTGM